MLPKLDKLKNILNGNGGDPIFMDVIDIIREYPNCDRKKINKVISDSRSKKIGQCLLNKDFKSLKVVDFTKVYNNGDFLHDCGFNLLEYGKTYGNVNCILLSKNLLEKSRSHFDPNSYDYLTTLSNEGLASKELSNLGNDTLNNLYSAIELFNKSIELGIEQYSRDYVITLINLGTVKKLLAGLGIEPISNLTESIKIYEIAKDNSKKGSNLFTRAIASEANSKRLLAGYGVDSKKNLEEAINYYSKSRQIFPKKSLFYARTLQNEGISWEMLGDYSNIPKEIIKNYNNAIKFYKKARLSGGIKKGTPDFAKTLTQEGNVFSKLAELSSENTFFDKALDSQEKALKTGGFVDKDYLHRQILLNKGSILFKLSLIRNEKTVLSEAEHIYLDNIKFFEDSNDNINLIQIFKTLGTYMYYHKRFKESYKYLKSSIDLIEKMRGSMDLKNRKSYFENVINTYKIMVFTCIELKKYDESFIYAESAKCRTFLEILHDKRINKNQNISEYEDNELKIKDIKSKIKNSSRNKSLNKKLQLLKRNRQDLIMNIKSEEPEYYSIKTAKPIDLDVLYSIINKKTLIEYFLGPKLAIFVINGQNLDVKTLNIDENEIKQITIEFKDIIMKIGRLNSFKTERHSLCADADKILEKLYGLLILPIEDLMSDELIIVPHSFLHNIPLQGLKKNHYLLENHKIFFAHSSSSLEFLNKDSSGDSLVVGNPNKGTSLDLPMSELEAVEVAKILGTKPLIGESAKKHNLVNKFKNSSIIHLACHGTFDNQNPSYSGILASDEIITAHEFMNMTLNSELMVLSACETALSEIVRGDELEGLVRSIHYAGCRFIIASLWTVEDNSTKDLFLKFYQESGDAADKLRKSEIYLMKTKDIYCWAPFQVYGI